MSARNLHKIFAPKSIVVVGASLRLGSVGGTVWHNLTQTPAAKATLSQRAVFAVNHKHEQLGDHACYRSIDDLPQAVDLAIICTPSDSVPTIVRQCGRRGILGLVILTAGFHEIGRAGEVPERELRAALAEFPKMRALGPNCLGFLSPHRQLNASFASDLPRPGKVAFISQSGALCTSVLDWSLQEDVGFSQFVSLGNMLDVSVADLIDYFADDGHTESIVMYIESITAAREFMSAARAFTRDRPILAYKAGRFTESAEAAASHTGALAGVDSVYEAAMARAGVVRVFDVDDLFDCAELLARHPAPSGERLAIVTNAGGPGVMATDCLLDRGGKLAKLSPQTIEQLNAALPPLWSHRNPIDVLGDATPERYAAALTATLADEQIDGILTILTPQAMTDPTGAARAVVEAAKSSRKPVLAAWMGGEKIRAGTELLSQAGIACYSTPEKAVRAFLYLAQYARNRETLYETPKALPQAFELDRPKLRQQALVATATHDGLVDEVASKQLLADYGIPVSETRIASSAEQAVEHAGALGYPVVLKILSPDITHKTDVGGVELNLATEPDVSKAYADMVARVKSRRPAASIIGVTVQPMVLAADGCELIVGAKYDHVFGTVLLVGAGGTTAELFHDRALQLPPLNERLARRMLESLKIWPILTGYRGKPAVNIERLIEMLVRLSYLVADHPEIAELDVNPLLATPTDVIALDARIALRRSPTPAFDSSSKSDQPPATTTRPPARYSHLAIGPYPDEFSGTLTLGDGTQVNVRPIQPEDEPLWKSLVESCSPETIRRRFRCMFKATTHEMASRFCFLDYDRELAMVAEVIENGEPRLIGVGRLIANANHTNAEYAVLVADDWQARGLGSQLTDYCLEIAGRWGVSQVVAEVASDNPRMLGMFRRRGFELQRDFDSDTVIATRPSRRVDQTEARVTQS